MGFTQNPYESTSSGFSSYQFFMNFDTDINVEWNLKQF